MVDFRCCLNDNFNIQQSVGNRKGMLVIEKIIQKILRIWIPVMLLIGFVVLAYLGVGWKSLDAGTKFVAGFYIILPLHVVEEWRIPGGFHYNYNTAMKSSRPDCFPMNQLTDMLTNFMAELIGVLLLFFGVNNVIITWHIFFCVLEMVIHSLFGCMMYVKFKAVGKRTWYNPGYLTAAAFFIMAVCTCIGNIAINMPSGREWILGLLFFLAEMVLVILIPENIFKSMETPYPFVGKYQYGYYAKFITKGE